MSHNYFGYVPERPTPAVDSNWKVEHHPFFKRHVCSSVDKHTGKRLWCGYSVALRANQNKPALHTPTMMASTYAELVGRLRESEKQLNRY